MVPGLFPAVRLESRRISTAVSLMDPTSGSAPGLPLGPSWRWLKPSSRRSHGHRDNGDFVPVSRTVRLCSALTSPAFWSVPLGTKSAPICPWCRYPGRTLVRQCRSTSRKMTRCAPSATVVPPSLITRTAAPMPLRRPEALRRLQGSETQMLHLARPPVNLAPPMSQAGTAFRAATVTELTPRTAPVISWQTLPC